MHRKFGLLSPGKVSSHSMARATQNVFFFPCVQCFRVSVFFYDRWIYIYRSLSWAQIWVHAIHMKGGQAQTSLHKSCLGGTEKKLSLTPCSTRGLNPGSSDLNFDILTTELHHHYVAQQSTKKQILGHVVVFFQWSGLTTIKYYIINFWYILKFNTSKYIFQHKYWTVFTHVISDILQTCTIQIQKIIQHKISKCVPLPVWGNKRLKWDRPATLRT